MFEPDEQSQMVATGIRQWNERIAGCFAVAADVRASIEIAIWCYRCRTAVGVISHIRDTHAARTVRHRTI